MVDRLLPSVQHLRACGALGTEAELLEGLRRLISQRGSDKVGAWPAVWCLTVVVSLTLSFLRSK